MTASKGYTLESLLSTLRTTTKTVSGSVTVTSVGDNEGKSSKSQSVFVKVGTGGAAADKSALEYEALALGHLRAITSSAPALEDLLYVPKVFAVGERPDGNGFLVMEHLSFVNARSCQKQGGMSVAKKLGKGLAMLHKHSAETKHYEFFGLERDGQCGAFPQQNNVEQKEMSWLEFWREYRLRPQLEGVKRSYPNEQQLIGLLGTLNDRLEEFIPPSLEVGKSLLHGDLWSGNWAALKRTTSDKVGGETSIVVAVFDPAAYYGHHEADLGIADMCGMPEDFYKGYFAELPPEAQSQPEGFPKRRMIYELHHHLNHVNIFGPGYCYGAVSLLKRLLS